MPAATVLVVDDERNILTSVSRALGFEGYEVEVAGSAEVALDKISKQSFDAILLDVQLPGMSGLELLDELGKRGVGTPVIMMSGHGTIDVAMEAVRRGADDFIEKPVGSDRLVLALGRSLRLRALQHENAELRRRYGAGETLLGTSPAIQRLRTQVELAARSNAAVLILGERGTGKELVASAIHAGSARAEGPFEKLNCAAVPEGLIESELFGHEAGAFTGATKKRYGKFERASGGTLFLDEIGDMPHQMQAKLLRVLQEGELERVGGSAPVRVDVRVVAATNKALGDEIEAGRFRADLFDRLNVVPLQVPPLRERADDVPLLAAHFLALACEAHDRPGKKLSADAMALLARYPYPGNVRELRNLVERLVILTPGEAITEPEARALLPIARSEASESYFQPETPLREMLEAAERDLITRALRHRDGHVTRTAADLGLERSHLYKKMRALGIRKPDSQ
ncbi:MAG: sigma-54-dependent Fis family transcriptional regulator [Deltaproteobacteria bacterium]|jgi:DNA-binding NtrC family response regulator|nr:sigma-54-dependent Fis family transcriptional regulator [Deltaproteobacteria bacterium]